MVSDRHLGTFKCVLVIMQVKNGLRMSVFQKFAHDTNNAAQVYSMFQ